VIQDEEHINLVSLGRMGRYLINVSSHFNIINAGKGGSDSNEQKEQSNSVNSSKYGIDFRRVHREQTKYIRLGN